MSNNFKCIIVDDNKHCISALRNLISKYFPQLTIVSEVRSVQDALKEIEKINPHIVFLDVEMPLENGTELFNYIKDPSFDVIFTTAFQDYAAQAFRLDSIDYLVKPIKPSELKEAIDKVKRKRNLSYNLNSDKTKFYSQEEKLSLVTLDYIDLISIKEIIYCEADNNYTSFNTLSKRIVVSKTLGFYEEQLLPYGFFRISRSHLVNLKHVLQVSKNQATKVSLVGDMSLHISSRRRKIFLQELEKFLVK